MVDCMWWVSSCLDLVNTGEQVIKEEFLCLQGTPDLPYVETQKRENLCWRFFHHMKLPRGMHSPHLTVPSPRFSCSVSDTQVSPSPSSLC